MKPQLFSFLCTQALLSGICSTGSAPRLIVKKHSAIQGKMIDPVVALVAKDFQFSALRNSSLTPSKTGQLAISLLRAILAFLHEMLPDDTRIEIENIVAGIILEGRANHCTTIRNSFCRRYETSTMVKAKFESNAIIKKEQADFIEAYCTEHSFWLENLPNEDRYLTRGGELGTGAKYCVAVLFLIL